MAALTSTQCVRVWDDGQSERTVLYSMRNVTAGDTADLAVEFSVVKRAVMLGTTLVGQGAISNIAGTTITLPNGPANDAGWLLVYGVHS